VKFNFAENSRIENAAYGDAYGKYSIAQPPYSK
jgi:hypothetical protein